MTLQTKVTFGSVLLATVVVTAVSGVNLGSFMDLELEATLERADVIKGVATGEVTDTLNRRRDVALREALRDPELKRKLLNLLRSPNGVLSIDMVSADNQEVLASTLDNRVGSKASEPDFSTLVRQRGWFEKLDVLLFNDRRYYMMQDPVGPGGATVFYVRVVIYPALIRPSLKDTLYQNTQVAILCIAGAVLLTFLFSLALFRSIGHIGQMLERVAEGDYQPEDLATSKAVTEDLSVMASKVTLLGERLRGAQFEVSDLRGNIDHLLQDLEDAVFIFNRELRLVFASGSVTRFLGRERDALAGESIAHIFPPAGNLGFLIAQASETGMRIRHRRIPLESMAQGAEPGAAVLLSVDLLQDQSGSRTGLLVRLRDPEAQRQIGRQLQTADRLAAISRISGGVAHEVKNQIGR